MDKNLVVAYIKQSLVHLYDDITLILTSLSPTKLHNANLDSDAIVDILIDLDESSIKFKEVQAFIVYIENLRESEVSFARLLPDHLQDVLATLKRSSLIPRQSNSAGIVVSWLNNRISLESSSPSLPRWGSLTSRASYYPIVSTSNTSQGGALDTFVSLIYGELLDESKNCIDTYKKVDECLLRIWCLIFNHWLGLNTIELNPLPAKTEVKDDIKITQNDDIIKTEFADIVIIPNGPKRKFIGVNISRKRRHNPVVDSESNASAPKKVKLEVKKEEENNVMLYEPTSLDVFKIPAYPPSWPASIIRRIDAIPKLQSLPALSSAFMSRTFDRREVSKAFGSSAIFFEGRWHRTQRALEEMPDSGNRFCVGAKPAYNFFLPHAPCAPGLIFHGPRANLEHGNKPDELLADGQPEPRTIFVRHEARAWQYLGEYRLRPSDPLREWTELTQEQRKLWKGHFADYKSSLEKNEMTMPQMHRALDSGERMLTVYTMECVGYHENIQKAIFGLSPPSA